MGTGGSRYGAGRPGWRRKCEHLLSLDIRKLARAGYIKPGVFMSGSWQWTWSHSGEPSGNIRIDATCDQVRLTYVWTPDGAEPKRFDYAVSVVRTPCRYGGSRPWFRCKWCGRRVAVLYGISGDGYFACRHCLRLSYSSESEDTLDRLWRKQRKLEAKLGEYHGRPKGMHQQTYERLIDRIDQVEEEKDTAFCLRAMALFGRFV